MRILVLDQNEFEPPASEQMLRVATARASRFASLEAFLAATHADGGFLEVPSLSEANRASEEELTAFLNSYSPEIVPFMMPMPPVSGWKLQEDWDHCDWVYTTPDYYVRLYWETTA